MSEEINLTRLRRMERDVLWLLKHFVYPILVRPYEHPEDFWFGSEDIWIKRSKTPWKFSKLWWCYWMNSFATQLFLAIIFHVGLLYLRPDIIQLFDIFNLKSLPGMFFYCSLFLSLLIGCLATAEHIRKEKKD